METYFHITDNIGWWGSWEVTAGSLILTAVPEPSSPFLLASLVGMFLLGRRRTQPARRAA
jgi:hypothetical protein